MDDAITIAGRELRANVPCFLIAEVGVNHNGDETLARRLIDAAVEARVDAVKFQTFRAAELVTPHAPRAPYQVANTGRGDSQRSLLAELELSDAVFEALREYCHGQGILFLSTPHTVAAARFLEPLVPCFKVASGDLTNLPFLRSLAQLGKPLLVSTGMGTLREVRDALRVIQEEGNGAVVALHCTTRYPCPLEEVQLAALATLRKQLGCLVGYSDHTAGIHTSIMAATLGAVCLEKHFTLDRNLEGPDHAASLTPEELREWATAVRAVPTILGGEEKRPTPAELEMRQAIRKSLVAAETIPSGTVIRAELLTAKRPGTGLSPADLERVIGKRARVAIPAETLITWDQLE